MTYKRFELNAFAYDKRGKLIASGENSYRKTHPLMKHFSSLCGQEHKIYLHAEVQALIRAGEQKVHRLVVTRYGAKGEPLLAKPCEVCQKAIEAYGVSVVEYTENGKDI